TTRAVVFDRNRNPTLDERSAEAAFRKAMGVQKLIWLEEGLRNDHTGGHVDNLVRFVAPGVVVCMEPRNTKDPNRELLGDIVRTLSASSDARGRRLQVECIPSPGLVMDDLTREALPASYCNFYVANGVVVVPLFGTPRDDEVLVRLGTIFSGRRVVGLCAY